MSAGEFPAFSIEEDIGFFGNLRRLNCTGYLINNDGFHDAYEAEIPYIKHNDDFDIYAH